MTKDKDEAVNAAEKIASRLARRAARAQMTAQSAVRAADEGAVVVRALKTWTQGSSSEVAKERNRNMAEEAIAVVARLGRATSTEMRIWTAIRALIARETMTGQ